MRRGNLTCAGGAVRCASQLPLHTNGSRHFEPPNLLFTNLVNIHYLHTSRAKSAFLLSGLDNKIKFQSNPSGWHMEGSATMPRRLLKLPRTQSGSDTTHLRMMPGKPSHTRTYIPDALNWTKLKALYWTRRDNKLSRRNFLRSWYTLQTYWKTYYFRLLAPYASAPGLHHPWELQWPNAPRYLNTVKFNKYSIGQCCTFCLKNQQLALRSIVPEDMPLRILLANITSILRAPIERLSFFLNHPEGLRL